MIRDYPTVWLERCLDIMALDPETAEQSVGLPCGLHRPELGPAIQDLACNNCGATWAGITGDPCWWCQRSDEMRDQYQHDMVLKAPDVDPDDATYVDRMWGWAQRMKVAVDAGVIEQDQAERAYRIAVRSVA